MPIGPEPKPIRTALTLRSLCITKDPLRTYKLFVRVYGGKTDEDLNTKHQNTTTFQKWVNLYDIMVDNFKGEGHCVTMDSAYTGDIMALIGHHEWKTDMVGTAQENRTLELTLRRRRRQQRRTCIKLQYGSMMMSPCAMQFGPTTILYRLFPTSTLPR